MSDIVERLRREWTRADGIVDREICVRAADLIERQAAELVEVKDRERRWKKSAEYTGQEIVKAEAEIERLREALNKIVRWGADTHNTSLHVCVIARAALRTE